MSLGSQIRRGRERAGRTQRQLAELAGVAPAYVSRLENDRVTPTLRTASRLATALGVSVGSLLDSKRPLETPDRCPVSLSGRCILDEPSGGRPRQRAGGRESYTPEDLRALRLCNLLLQSGNRRAVRTLITVLDGLLAMGRRS
jgi:transcriptional regulator with XRE-family HTH domain